MTLLLRTIIISGMLILPCTTKVSEWVLLNVAPEEYQLIYYHNGSGEPFKPVNNKFSGEIASANISLREEKKESSADPWYGLYYRNRLVMKLPDQTGLNNLMSSPLRDKIAAEIMAGKLCVMVYLKTDIPAKDDSRKKVIFEKVKDSPFRDIITVTELSRNNIEESHFISMLLNVESDLKGINEPMLFGIFGRFRALEPLLAGGITAENVGYMISFLSADCSCLVKDDLPGADILYNGKWENPVPALVNKILDENPSLQHR